jgi:hypothetical protein
MPYHAGSERTARKTLEERWETMVEEEAGDNAGRIAGLDCESKKDAG